MPFLIYGAYGYTGRLIAEASVRRGWEPTLAGRDEARLHPLADELGRPYRTFDLTDAAALDAALAEVSCVLHCAGPFAYTAAPMVEGCLRTETHYLDITGEIEVYEMLAALDAPAQAAGVMLLPGVGFDVVPTDCLAAHLHAQLPTATQLELAILSRGGVSHGTAKTAVEQLRQGGFVRRGGRLQEVPIGWRTRSVDFGEGPLAVTAIPWGDLATAYRSTGIPHITTYMRLPPLVQQLAPLGAWIEPVLASSPVQAVLKQYVAYRSEGPSTAARERGESTVWGEVVDDAGRRAAARLHGPEPYAFTVEAALAAVRRVLDGTARPGYQTPSTAFGADFVFDVDGVRREEVT